MEENNNKKHAPNRKEGNKNDRQGQRISVRPGNFNPPPQDQGGPAPAPRERKEGNEQHAEQNAVQREGGQNRHHNHRGGRHHGRGNDQRQSQAAPAAEAIEPKSRPAQSESRNESRNENRAERKANRQERRDGRHGRQNDRRREEREPRREAAPALSDALRRELDEEFSTPTLSPAISSPKKDPKKEQEAVDSKEFEVDIATAAYLLDDIPCGFPIPDGKAVEVVGVRFRHAGKVYFFAPGTDNYRIGEEVLVDTARGSEIGEIVMLKRKIAERDVIQPLRAVLRKATAEDKRHEQENRQKEIEALKLCADKIAAHKLDMKLVDAQFTFDNSKLLFYFTSEGRVDFRELVRDLAGVFHTRIELRQIGIRDEARLIGGLGMCGRPFCCSTYLSDFGQVSIKMAKEQGLSINTSKISGCCGRLMCCLRYEHEAYAAETKLTPKKDTPVATPDGNGVVVEATPLTGTVKVRLDSAPEEAPKAYHRDSVTVLQKEHRAPRQDTAEDEKPANGVEKDTPVPAPEATNVGQA